MADELIVLGQNLETASASLGGERLQLIAAEQGRLVARLPTDLTAGEYTLVVLNQSGVDEQQLTLLQGERGEQGEPGTPMSFLMSEDRTLRVPIDFPSLAEALASLDQLRISARATVTVLVEADQVLNEPLEISHPDGERISILGLSAASPAVTLSFGSGDGIVIPRGNKLGGLNHLRLTASDGARGIAVSDGGYASIQSDVRIENFEVCVSANRNSTVIAPGIEAVGCGRGVEASDGSHVTLTGATITNSESNGVFLFNGANARVDDLSVNGAGESGLVVQTGAVAYGENVVVLNA
ncbi:MAG: right-handed parallel beta-helix repeat-containing protein, partial [Myxococcota bacterium]